MSSLVIAFDVILPPSHTWSTLKVTASRRRPDTVQFARPVPRPPIYPYLQQTITRPLYEVNVDFITLLVVTEAARVPFGEYSIILV